MASPSFWACCRSMIRMYVRRRSNLALAPGCHNFSWQCFISVVGLAIVRYSDPLRASYRCRWNHVRPIFIRLPYDSSSFVVLRLFSCNRNTERIRSTGLGQNTRNHDSCHHCDEALREQSYTCNTCSPTWKLVSLSSTQSSSPPSWHYPSSTVHIETFVRPTASL